jgi:hypothetical protein
LNSRGEIACRILDLLIFDGVIAVLTITLIVTFVSSFIAIAMFGHVLLIAAVWPDVLGKRRKPQPNPEGGPDRYLPLSS